MPPQELQAHNTDDGWMLLVRRPPLGAVLLDAYRDYISNKFVLGTRDAWVFCSFKYGMRKCVVDAVNGDGNAVIIWPCGLKYQVREEQLIMDK